MLKWPPSERAVVCVVLLGIGATLIATSTPRRVGDGGEYLAMAIGIRQFGAASLSPEQLEWTEKAIDALGPAFADPRLTQPTLRGADGRQDFFHFWLYPALAVPFVSLALAAGLHLNYGFAFLNVLLWAAAGTLATRARALTAFIFVSPILWWLDKAHGEVFLFSLLAMAFALLEDAPTRPAGTPAPLIIAGLSLGLAAAQNPALVVLLPLPLLTASGPTRWRALAGTAVGAVVAAIHPLYYWVRLGVPTPLVTAARQSWPTGTELSAVAIDPNIGLLGNYPQWLAAVGLAALFLMRRSPFTLLRRDIVGAFLATTGLLVMFAQTLNVNSGGTPGPSRYAIWLVPLALPLLSAAYEKVQARNALTALAVASAVWCMWEYSPDQPEGHLKPTRLAEGLWHHAPAWYNGPPEIFAERTSGFEPGTLPSAAGCAKILFAGDLWPHDCPRAAVPSQCQQPEMLCYANRIADDGYAFVAVPRPRHPFLIIR